ncbi:hypothetical protein K502DRAFT_348344 [Neoconidiobolus thromboides FSU 785]|nr:hypothetical protein K502DRAFT_348344 [Neoconidiobolus thromboides FSU 785]
MSNQLYPPPTYEKRDTRSSLNRLLADNLMVQQLMDYEKEKGYTLVDVPYSHKDLETEKKIESRLNQLNTDLEKELSEFRQKFPTTPSSDKKSSIGERIRRSLFPSKRGDDQEIWKKEAQTYKNRRRGKPSFGCLVLILVLLAILVTSLTLVLVFTINQPHSHNPNLSTKEALNDSALNGSAFNAACDAQIRCFNSGVPVLIDGKCRCKCKLGLTGDDCRTLIVPAGRDSST